MNKAKYGEIERTSEDRRGWEIERTGGVAGETGCRASPAKDKLHPRRLAESSSRSEPNLTSFLGL